MSEIERCRIVVAPYCAPFLHVRASGTIQAWLFNNLKCNASSPVTVSSWVSSCSLEGWVVTWDTVAFTALVERCRLATSCMTQDNSRHFSDPLCLSPARMLIITAEGEKINELMLRKEAQPFSLYPYAQMILTRGLFFRKGEMEGRDGLSYWFLPIAKIK